GCASTQVDQRWLALPLHSHAPAVAPSTSSSGGLLSRHLLEATLRIRQVKSGIPSSGLMRSDTHRCRSTAPPDRPGRYPTATTGEPLEIPSPPTSSTRPSFQRPTPIAGASDTYAARPGDGAMTDTPTATDTATAAAHSLFTQVSLTREFRLTRPAPPRFDAPD